MRALLVGAVVFAVGVAAAAWAVGRDGGDGDYHSGNLFTDPPDPVCRTQPTKEPNVRTDCEFRSVRRGMVYSNSTTLAVNPRRPANIVAAADDNQILFVHKDKELVYAFPRVRASEDGGRTWTTYAVDWGGMNANDSHIAFDADGTAYLAAIARVGDANPSVYVASSGDGGRRWSAPVRVAAGEGGQVDGVLNDAVALTAWGSGNAVVTWAQYRLQGGYAGSPIVASVTHDGGRTWTAPVTVSGSAPFCTGVTGDRACDQAQSSQPVVTADGHVLVSFVATDKAGIATNINANTLMVAELDPTSGAPMAGPFPVAPLVDAASAYPVGNASSLPTLHHSQFITGSLGAMAADPTDPAHLAQVWSDMRNSPTPPTDPYRADTNADIVVSHSLDRGRTWSPPVALAAAGDQFQPAAVFDASGRLRIGYFDRSYDPANERYGYTVAAEAQPRSHEFQLRPVTTALSDPTRNDHFYAQQTFNPDFPHPTGTIGDYTALATTPSGVMAYWTDLRGSNCFGGRCAADQGTYVAEMP